MANDFSLGVELRLPRSLLLAGSFQGGMNVHDANVIPPYGGSGQNEPKPTAGRRGIPPATSPILLPVTTQYWCAIIHLTESGVP